MMEVSVKAKGGRTLCGQINDGPSNINIDFAFDCRQNDGSIWWPNANINGRYMRANTCYMVWSTTEREEVSERINIDKCIYETDIVGNIWMVGCQLILRSHTHTHTHANRYGLPLAYYIYIQRGCGMFVKLL